MNREAPDRTPTPRASVQRRWQFARCTVDEANRMLAIDDVPVEIEAKPFDILIELLRHAGEVVTEGELLDAVWPGVTVVEGSLTTALSKLRCAIDDSEAEIIVTVPLVGYRLAAAVTVQASEGEAAPLAIEAGMAVPDRPHWRYAELLGRSPHTEVWRIVHENTGAAHVLKLTADADCLRALKREVAVSRLLRETLGERPDVVSVLDWNFAEAPFFLESIDGGPNLAAWADAQGGLSAVPLALRIELLARIASTVAAAHGLGVLHKDLKPANVLVAIDRNGHWQPKVIDFGTAALLEPERLAGLGITHTPGEPSSVSTAQWHAPELFTGATPGVAADVYALGVMLYQLVVGDLRRPLSSDWEHDIPDRLLADDIAAATAGDPARRLDSAAELARRLRAFDQRRQDAATAAMAEARMRTAESRLARVRARRPWVAAVCVTLMIGTGVSGALAVRASQERDNALHQTQIADTVNRFLSNDLLARSDPFHAAAADETLADAVRQAAPQIDRRFASEPAVAARLHQTIANAFDKRNAWADARLEYARADAMWRKAGMHNAPDTVVNELQQAMMEARAYRNDGLRRAKALLAAAAHDIDGLPEIREDIPVWRASARGMVALVGNDVREAQRQFRIAVETSAGLPQFDTGAQLTFRQRLAFTRIRLDDGLGAERDFRALYGDYAAIEGPDGPNALMMRMNLTQALLHANKLEEAIAESGALYPRLAARLGEDHEMTLQLLLTRGETEGTLERYADMIRDDMHVHDLAAKKLGPASFFTLASLVDAATAQCRSGQPAAGLANARQAHAAALAGLGKVALSDAAAYTIAECEIDLAHYADAARDLQGIDAASVAQLAGDADWGANVGLAKARIAAGQGDREGAAKQAEALRGVFGRKDAEPYSARLWKGLLATR